MVASAVLGSLAIGQHHEEFRVDALQVEAAKSLAHKLVASPESDSETLTQATQAILQRKEFGAFALLEVAKGALDPELKIAAYSALRLFQDQADKILPELQLCLALENHQITPQICATMAALTPNASRTFLWGKDTDPEGSGFVGAANQEAISRVVIAKQRAYWEEQEKIGNIRLGSKNYSPLDIIGNHLVIKLDWIALEFNDGPTRYKNAFHSERDDVRTLAFEVAHHLVPFPRAGRDQDPDAAEMHLTLIQDLDKPPLSEADFEKMHLGTRDGSDAYAKDHSFAVKARAARAILEVFPASESLVIAHAHLILAAQDPNPIRALASARSAAGILPAIFVKTKILGKQFVQDAAATLQSSEAVQATLIDILGTQQQIREAALPTIKELSEHKNRRISDAAEKILEKYK